MALNISDCLCPDDRPRGERSGAKFPGRQSA